jgi:N6-L-threonylcarbamoyladenine synthase
MGKDTQKIVLGIETSCDETAAAIVTEDRQILSNIVFSQIEDHKNFGGVVPEIAARSHLEQIDKVIKQSLAKAKTEFSDLSAIAATCGPGLIGGVLVGAVTAKAIAAYYKKPFIAVNHLEGHALTVRLTDNICFPYLLLLASGGHTQLLLVKGVGQYQELGSTIDDAAGEAFDKIAKLLDLGFPGGPAVEKAALKGNPQAFKFPRSLCQNPGCNFSFSGLKTAVLRAVEKLKNPTEQNKFDLAASFQQAVVDIMVDRCTHALNTSNASVLVVAGGVAANKKIRDALENLGNKRDVRFIAPPLPLCTDNGAMIAWAGMEKFLLGKEDPLDFSPRPRWPLAGLS